MPDGQVLEFSGATKRFGAVTAVSEFTARVEPGVVTGFLGPNGAGKTTSLRMLLGLVRPTAGSATVGGVRYAKLKNPLQTVGAVLEASSFHPGRTGAAHLRVYAQAARVSNARVDEVLGLVGLADAAGRKVGGYSLGMRQRLGLAYALLGDPGVLVLDEPTNGLDPEGIKWIRGFLRQLAREGRTVFVSSHLLAEVQQTVDALLIISRGRLVFQGALEELSDPGEQATVVDSADRAALAEALRNASIPFEVLRSGLTVRGIEPIEVGLAAAAAGVPLTALQKRGPALEEVFLDLVNGTRVHASASGTRMDDVIPAIESGPAVVVPASDQEADAATSVPAEGEAEAGVAEAQPEVEAEAEPEPDVEVAAEGEVVEAEPADDAVEAAAEAEPEVVAVEPDAEPEPGPDTAAEFTDVRTASFAVASTGVIDIIPGDAEADAEPDAEPGPEPEAEPGAAADEASEGGDDERAWDEYVRTDADVEADRFFAAFDRAAAGGASAAEPPAPEDSAPEAPPAEAPPAEEPPTEDDARESDDDPEGGEQR